MSILGGTGANGLLTFDKANFKPNRFYFVTGNNDENANWLIKSLCWDLRDAIVNVHCFCPDDKARFYREFLPPPFVHTQLKIDKLAEIFNAQKKLMERCELQPDTDARGREFLKSTCNTLIIIDRCNFSSRDDKVIMEPEFNDLLRKALLNNITVIYRNVIDAGWQKKIPQTLLNRALCICVSNQSTAQFKNIYDNFGSKISQNLKFKDFSNLISTHATNGYTCAVVSNNEPICHIEETDAFTEDHKLYFTFYEIPHHMNNFKMGLQEWHVNFQRKKTESECSSQNRYDARVLDALNLISSDRTLRVSIGPKKKPPTV